MSIHFSTTFSLHLCYFSLLYIEKYEIISYNVFWKKVRYDKRQAVVPLSKKEVVFMRKYIIRILVLIFIFLITFATKVK